MGRRPALAPNSAAAPAWFSRGSEGGIPPPFLQPSACADLRLPSSACTPAGAIWFSRGFKEHTNGNLTELELGYNEIKDEGACALAQVRMDARPDLTWLDLA